VKVILIKQLNKILPIIHSRGLTNLTNLSPKMECYKEFYLHLTGNVNAELQRGESYGKFY
jgi:hypothetical protein